MARGEGGGKSRRRRSTTAASATPSARGDRRVCSREGADLAGEAGRAFPALKPWKKVKMKEEQATRRGLGAGGRELVAGKITRQGANHLRSSCPCKPMR